MKLSLGDEVVLIHTGEKGYIVDWVDDETALVSVDDFEIPVALTDLAHAYEHTETPPSPPAAAEKHSETKEPTDSGQPGIFISFKPLDQPGKELTGFDIFLVNNTEQHLLYSYELSLAHRLVKSDKSRVDARDTIKLGKLALDDLNDVPALKLDFWPEKTPTGKKHHFGRTIKPKARNFFNKLKPTPLLHTETYLYLLFEDIPAIQPNVISDVEFRRKKPIHLPEMEQHEMFRKASLPTAIDLHIEKLVDDNKARTNLEILTIQLNHFQRFLEQAIVNRLPRIYVIHGLGKGKLRQEIFKILEEHEAVISFNNDYHPKYGHGATEINFQ